MPSWQSPLQAKCSQVLARQKLPLCSFAVNTFLHPHFPTANDPVSVPTDLPFQECLTNGIIQYVPLVSGFFHFALHEIHPCHYSVSSSSFIAE